MWVQAGSPTPLLPININGSVSLCGGKWFCLTSPLHTQCPSFLMDTGLGQVTEAPSFSGQYAGYQFRGIQEAQLWEKFSAIQSPQKERSYLRLTVSFSSPKSFKGSFPPPVWGIPHPTPNLSRNYTLDKLLSDAQTPSAVSLFLSTLLTVQWLLAGMRQVWNLWDGYDSALGF